MSDYDFAVAQKLEAQLAQARKRIAELEAAESSAIIRAGEIIGRQLTAQRAMPPASPPTDQPTWRVGKSLGRTLYCDEHCIGIVDTPDLAAAIVEAMNAHGGRT